MGVLWMKLTPLIYRLLFPVTPFSLEANLVEQLPAVPERESGSQTDAFVARAISNQKGWAPDGAFLRPKVGVDSSTQVSILLIWHAIGCSGSSG